MKREEKKARRERRHVRIRRKVMGTAERPRLCVMVSNRHIHAQFVNDEGGLTLVALSTSGSETGQKNVDGATALGRRLGEMAREKGISACVFDRGGFKYHGRVKAVAEAVRAAGIAM